MLNPQESRRPGRWVISTNGQAGFWYGLVLGRCVFHADEVPARPRPSQPDWSVNGDVDSTDGLWDGGGPTQPSAHFPRINSDATGQKESCSHVIKQLLFWPSLVFEALTKAFFLGHQMWWWLKYDNINILFDDLFFSFQYVYISRFNVLLFVTYSIIQDIISSEM